MIEIGRLVDVPAREIWQNEARDFTPWLLANKDVLEAALGIEVELQANEHRVGGFSLDLIGRDLTNECVLIVENQLEATDHGHLGQLLTYAAGTEAATIVWIANDFREEHRQALDWLNRLCGEHARFFGVQVAVVRIGDSPPAPNFKLRAQPNDWHAQVARSANEQAEGGRGLLYLDFWSKLLRVLGERSPGLTGRRTPAKDSWFDLRTLARGVRLVATFDGQRRLRVDVYIDTQDEVENARLFRLLEEDRAGIEQACGEELIWEPLASRRACRVAVARDGTVDAVDLHPDYLEWLVSRLVRLSDVFTERLRDGVPA